MEREGVVRSSRGGSALRVVHASARSLKSHRSLSVPLIHTWARTTHRGLPCVQATVKSLFEDATPRHTRCQRNHAESKRSGRRGRRHSEGPVNSKGRDRQEETAQKAQTIIDHLHITPRRFYRETKYTWRRETKCTGKSVTL